MTHHKLPDGLAEAVGFEVASALEFVLAYREANAKGEPGTGWHFWATEALSCARHLSKLRDDGMLHVPAVTPDAPALLVEAILRGLGPILKGIYSDNIDKD